MNQYEAPYVNGICKWADKNNPAYDEVKVLAVKLKLETIQAEFVPTYGEPTLDGIIVMKYHAKHKDDVDYVEINGDTAEFILN